MLANGQEEIVISTDGGGRYEQTKENVWHFVDRFDIKKWNDDPKSVTVKEISGDDIVSMSIVRDNRLSS